MTVQVTHWKAAALANFRKIIADMVGRPVDEIIVHTFDHESTAAVSWGPMDEASLRINLFLPMMRPGARLTAADQKAFAGFWVHEALHVLKTDRKAWRRACVRSKAFAGVVNGLEDVRMEREAVREDKIPGAWDVLEAITERAVWGGDVTVGSVNSKANLPAVLAYLGRARLIGYKLSKADAMAKALTPSNAKIVARVLSALDQAKNTQDVVDIVDRIFKGGYRVDEPATPDADIPDELKDLLNELPENFDTLDNESTQGEGQEGQEGQEGAGQEGQEGEGAGGEDGDASFADISDETSVNSAEPDSVAKDIADKVNDGASLTEHERDVVSDAETLLDRRGTLTNLSEVDAHSVERAYRQLFGAISGAGKMRIAARRLAKSLDRYGWDANQEAGRLDPRAYGRAKLGARDIYKVSDNQEGQTAAVMLLLDGSGSMGSIAAHQSAMAVAVADAIERAGAPVAVSAFGVQQGLAYIKKFGERIAKRKGSFVASRTMPNGGTPLSPGMVAAATDLTKQKADRHILIAMTDGMDNFGPEAVRASTLMCQQMGVEVVAIVIKKGPYGASVRDFGFDLADASSVTKPDEMGATVLENLVKQLEKKVRRAA